jgi:DNA-binding MarR family transcriptional regulator
LEVDIGGQLRAIGILLKRKMEASATMQECQSLTGLHRMVIKYLHQNISRDVFQRDIEEKFTIRRSTSTQLLKLMEKNGLICKQKVPYDARLVKLTLTEKALSMHKKIHEDMAEMNEQMVKGLTDKEIEDFIVITNKIKKNLE